MRAIKSLLILVVFSQNFLLSCQKKEVLIDHGAPANALPPIKNENSEEDSTLAFFNEIEQFEQRDSILFPPANVIEFTGSSSIRLWNNLESYFPGYVIIKRGFGGSGLTDLYHYIGDIISPYHPKQVVIYCGENDIAAGRKPADILQKFIADFTQIRTDLPDANVVYVSIKPSPKLKAYLSAIQESNGLVKKFLSTNDNTQYVDVYDVMLGKDGNLRKDLYRQDGLHMTTKGYEIWKKAIIPVLLK